ncbi:acyl-CoA dehydrogenase family protein [Actinomadura algeriensis]|uniref:Alkylation response protein AidB-like acyl-CoA dehydrogenase n=1 Tax=Actinomadura algeriensis TaxID=1679523 RepID=A0ABR9K1Z2_9ACTN|nr:acyl-CoA dehydrogenase [Actinomadura algeriensis]MBE1536874.1 alkylation response protein AidB-like acyl-CoA dehydrogenase [Actinomadura algeriensis]
MELSLSPDQKLLQESARGLLEQEYSLDRIRGMEGNEPRWSRDWWRKGAELGWAAAIVPEKLGGGSVSGEGVRDLAVLAEELGAGVAPGPLLPVNVVLAGLVAAHGHGPGHAAEIEALVAGESIATWAVYEPGREWTPSDPGLTAAPADGGYVLDGVKDRVEDARQADLLLVTARTPDGVAQFLVPASASGVTISEQWTVDLSRSFGEVRFDGARVDAGALVGEPGADGIVERQLQIAVVVQCAEVCAVLDRAFAMTTQWAFDRYSFGRPLASYQALKHRFADMRTWLEACHATTQAAAAAVQADSPDAAELISVAKSFVGERSLTILQDCVQLHGGIGVTWEHDLHLFLRRAILDQALYGTPADHRLRLADLAAL